MLNYPNSGGLNWYYFFLFLFPWFVLVGAYTLECLGTISSPLKCTQWLDLLQKNIKYICSQGRFRLLATEWFRLEGLRVGSGQWSIFVSGPHAMPPLSTPPSILRAKCLTWIFLTPKQPTLWSNKARILFY